MKLENLAALKTYEGKTLPPTEWIRVTQKMVNAFAEATLDFQWIHIDVERAKKESPFKAPVAHGFMSIALASKFLEMAVAVQSLKMGVNYGLNKVRFTNAVPAGALIRGRVGIKEYKEIKGGARYTMDIVFEIKGQERPACVAEWIGQAYAAPAQKVEEAPKVEAPN